MAILQVDKNKLSNTIVRVEEMCDSYNKDMAAAEDCVQSSLSAAWDGDDKVAFNNRFMEQFSTSSDAYSFVKQLEQYRDKLKYAREQYEWAQRESMEEAESLTDLLSFLG